MKLPRGLQEQNISQSMLNTMKIIHFLFLILYMFMAKFFPIAVPSQSNSNKADFHYNKYIEAVRFWSQPNKPHKKAFNNCHPINWQQVIQTLKNNQMSPAIAFSFSIANCEKSAGFAQKAT